VYSKWCNADVPYSQQYLLCAYNITLRRARAVEKRWVLHNLSVCICSVRYKACNEHAPYFHLWLAPLYNIFQPFLTNGTIFGKKKSLNTKCVFWFSLQLLFETFLILRRNERDTIKNIRGLELQWLGHFPFLKWPTDSTFYGDHKRREKKIWSIKLGTHVKKVQ